ncbi:F-box domain, Leucine-rich repeat domain, L domain-like protein [Artemisia annua]|uniref:F-box domain, Leucine-rich repeat domain, L domain-like protein n=1 Tax=Artemisia annua TaxID=35608 RepID=A0A2U1NZ60_ARTAN|nr:F-box domain, Leucine-rich repeat domain, L domain-like protein [Artemisia annua]
MFGIVHQVDTISLTYFTDPLVDTSNLRPHGSAIGSLMLFEKVKSLCIIFPSSVDNDSLYKWKVNFDIGLIAFIYLSPNSLYRNKELYVSDNGHEEEEDMDLSWKNARQCLKDAVKRFRMLVYHVISLPLLEKVAITDLGKREKVSLSGGKVAEVRNWLSSPSGETIEQKMKFLQTGCRASECYVSLLELPVSGYVMKGVYLFLAEWNDLANDNYDSFMKNNVAFEDKEETAYFEARLEILKKHTYYAVILKMIVDSVSSFEDS